jgi:hypothetical protein
VVGNPFDIVGALALSVMGIINTAVILKSDEDRTPGWRCPAIQEVMRFILRLRDPSGSCLESSGHQLAAPHKEKL